MNQGQSPTQSEPLAESVGFDPKHRLKQVPNAPGVYRFYDNNASVIYVGKAKDLKKRVSSYFRKNLDSAKTRQLVKLICDLQFTVTNTENEALLLENNFIKLHKPRFNILLRDDKSYPYIKITSDTFPRIAFHRGAKKKGTKYFGPYPSVASVRASLNLLQKVFPVRQCEDSVYKNRSRPCLQYQIKRCTAPCVNFVSKADYQQDVKYAEYFLSGKGHEVIEEIAEKMESASAQLQFEQAARFRDQIQALRKIQERQIIDSKNGNIDVLSVVVASGVAVVQTLVIRQGRILGSNSYYPKNSGDETAHTVLDAFLPQYYLGDHDIPSEIIVPFAIDNGKSYAQTFGERAGKKVRLTHQVRGDRARWLQMANTNAEGALHIRLSARTTVKSRLVALKEVLELDSLPKRMECFDISHTQGEHTVASCVVFNEEGPFKEQYRRFNIEGITGGDDYAAMHQALSRRYKRVKSGEVPTPDILFIDGGKGQVHQATAVLNELAIEDMLVIGVAKGADRKAGLETLIAGTTGQEIVLPADSPALHLIQHIRDESHRFAISGHRNQRNKARTHSTLEEIPGIGPKRRKDLLKSFGGIQGIRSASVEALMQTKGINQAMAQLIYDYFHHG